MEPTMNVLPQDKELTQPEAQKPRFLIGVRLRNREKTRQFDPGGLKLRVGSEVVVESKYGNEIGVVASNKVVNVRKDNCKEIKRILRIANENDHQAEARRENLERRAKKLCSQKIEELSLPMNLSRVVHAPPANKTIFFFTAEGRVDFRQLIKELASKLRHRIEMKQVGVRDEAREIGGNGICGESLCCSTFLKEFSPVTIRMAKDQGLALNPSKISGVCGRLMCCLQYEHDTYRNLIKGLPKLGSRLETPDGPGKVLKHEILEQKVMVRLDDESILVYHLDELKESLKAKQAGPS